MSLRSLLVLPFASAAITPVAAAQAPPRWELRTLSSSAIASTRAAIARDGSVLVLAADGIIHHGAGEPRRLALPRAIGRSVAIAARADSLVVFGADGVAVLGADGRVLRIIRPAQAPGGAGLSLAAPVALLRDGSMLAVPRFDVELAARGALSEVPILRLPPGGVAQSVLARRSLRHFGMRIVAGRGRVIATRQPWHDEELLAVPGGGDWVAVVDREPSGSPGGAAFRVTRFAPDGRRVWEHSYRYTPQALPADAVDEMVQAYAQGIVGEATPEATRAVRAALWLPPALPPVAAAVAARDGTLWLRRESAVEDAPQVLWTVLGPAGELMGEVSVPGTWMIVDADGARVWAIARGTGGAATLLRLQRATSG
jgi:hypothetical protein